MRIHRSRRSELPVTATSFRTATIHLAATTPWPRIRRVGIPPPRVVRHSTSRLSTESGFACLPAEAVSLGLVAVAPHRCKCPNNFPSTLTLAAPSARGREPFADLACNFHLLAAVETRPRGILKHRQGP